MDQLCVRLRPVTVGDLAMFRRFATEAELFCLGWYGFQDAGSVERRFADDGYLGARDGRLVVDVDGAAAGFVSWVADGFRTGRYWSIGVALLPECRGRGIGWRAQDLLCEYLFAHAPVQRIQAGTQPENIAQQKALTKAGFTREGVMRCAEFRAGEWRDIWLYSRIRDESRQPLLAAERVGSA